MRREEWLIHLDELVKESVDLHNQERNTRDCIHKIWMRHYPRCGFCGKEDSVRLEIWDNGNVDVMCWACNAHTPYSKDVIDAVFLWDAMLEAQETLNALKDPSTGAET